MIFGRFGNELYKFDPDTYHPGNALFKEILNPILIIGRGTGQNWWTPFLNSGDSVIPVDCFGGMFKESAVHLWIDFNSIEALQLLPRNWAKSIVVDYSTWRYLKPSEKAILNQWRDLLQENGTLCFENGPSSIKLRPEAGSIDYDCDNPSHVCLSMSTLSNLMDLGQCNAFLAKFKGSRIVIPAATQDLGIISLKVALLPWLFQQYHQLFIENGFRSIEFLDTPFPIDNRGISYWVQVTK